MILEQTYMLPNGVSIPKPGLGAWFINDDKAAKTGWLAVKCGYRL